MKCHVVDEFFFFVVLPLVGQEKSSRLLLVSHSRRKSRAPRTKKELKKIGC